MKLLSINLCNFRQFYGKSPEIILAGDEKNTTILHGNNGAGKTTLLNAFTWVLYEKFSDGFAAPDQLVNKRAITEAPTGQTVVCWVELVFEHDNKRYQVKRICRISRNSVGVVEAIKERLRMQIAGNDGKWMLPTEPPEEIIGQILPDSLHQYFFFDGERIEQIVRQDKKQEISEATKKLLGVEVLNRSINHLKEAKKSLETELRGIGDYETKNILRDKQNFEKEIKRLEQRQGEIEQELQNQGEIKKTISSRRLELEGADKLQQLRDELEREKESCRQKLKLANETIKELISGRGYTVLLPELTADFRSLVAGLRESGELPTGIKRQFVEDLLQQERCICGAELKEGSHAHNLVRSWMEKAGIADVEETAIRMSAQVEEIDNQGLQFWQEIDRKLAEINEERQKLSRIENKLEDTKKDLRNFPDEDVSQLQRRLDEIEQRVSEYTKELGSNEQQINSLILRVGELAKQIDKHKMNEIKQVLAQRRIAATQDAIERISEVRQRLDQQFRSQLERRIQEIFSEISFTPYLPRLNDKYEVILVENTAGKELPVAASTGENQILSLSFIGGIIDRVREWSKRNTLMGPDSSTFPIVMDSPFGSLDEISRRRVASALPKLANQLIVLVTKTQWRGEVAEEMADWIGKEYVLVYNSPKPDCQEDFIEIRGVRYPLVKQSPNEFEYTEIVDVDADNVLGSRDYSQDRNDF